MSETNKRIDNIANEVKGGVQSLEFTQKELKDLKTHYSHDSPDQKNQLLEIDWLKKDS